MLHKPETELPMQLIKNKRPGVKFEKLVLTLELIIGKPSAAKDPLDI